MNDYWADRVKAQEIITSKNIAQTNEILLKQFQKSMRFLLDEFDKTYNKVLSLSNEGKKPSPSDLYKLDKYWKLQAQLQQELTKLGDKQAKALSRQFMNEYKQIYESIALKSPNGMFAKFNPETAKQAINAVWVADGKTWSQRVWNNTARLQETLNEELVRCVACGASSEELKKSLIKRFDVAYHRANTLVITELTHIQTQSAKTRYEDSGIKKYQIVGTLDDKTCPICRRMIGKQFYLADLQEGVNAPPFHPNARCCIKAVIE